MLKWHNYVFKVIFDDKNEQTQIDINKKIKRAMKLTKMRGRQTTQNKGCAKRSSAEGRNETTIKSAQEPLLDTIKPIDH